MSLDAVRPLLSVALLLTAVAFFAVTALGMFRFRVMYDRLHVATKCLTGGVLSVLLSYTVTAPTGFALGKALLGAAFLLMTNAIASHALARAAYRQQCDTDKLSIDQLAEDIALTKEVPG